MHRLLPIALGLTLGLGALPDAATSAEYTERYSVSFGGFSPSGPATVGTFLSFNLGHRLTDHLRVGGEIGWYRRDYESRYLLVGDPVTRTGVQEDSIASTHIFPILGTADFFLPARGHIEPYVGGGLGFDIMRTKHFPFNRRSFSNTFTGLGFMARGGISTRPGGGAGAVYVEGFYKGSTIEGEDALAANQPADVEARSRGIGFRVGFRW